MAAGKARDQQSGVCCQSSKNQGRIRQEGPDISLLEPALQKQWDHDANGHVTNVLITPHSSRKVSWTCDQCPDGHPHSWLATVFNRSYGSGCPQCCGRKVCKHNSLATKAPLVAAQWDHETNSGTPDTVVANSSQKVGWHCDVCGHKWNATPKRRVSDNTGCPQCARFKKWTRRPTVADHPLLAEWDHERNSERGNYPDNTTLQSHKQIFWLCNNCPAGQQHSWSTAPFQRTGRNKHGCPVCAGKKACRCNSLQALRPDIAAEWDYSRNEGQPSDYTACSMHLAWWSRPQRGSRQQTINSRTQPNSRQAKVRVRNESLVGQG